MVYRRNSGWNHSSGKGKGLPFNCPDEIRRLNRLTTDLLDLAKMEAGEITINPVNFNINELIRRCIIKLENFITQKDIELRQILKKRICM